VRRPTKRRRRVFRTDFAQSKSNAISRDGIQVPVLHDPTLRSALVGRYGAAMSDFEVPADLTFNNGPIADPEGFAREAGAASWLYLCGEEFTAMDGGMSYDQVQAAVPKSQNIISDPPR